MKKALVVGLGIGSLYEKILKDLFFDVYTVDIDTEKKSNYTIVEQIKEKDFEIGIICLPNFLHKETTEKLISLNCKNILVEKPGFSSLKEYCQIKEKADINNSNLFIVKNNFFRKEIKNFRLLFNHIKKNKISEVDIVWSNKNRIPSPGSWFTNKELSWGGVSRDLIPHLLHIFYFFSKSFDSPTETNKKQVYDLTNIKDSDYGSVNIENPVYNVDDSCYVKFLNKGITYNLYSTWKNDTKTEMSIKIKLSSGEDYTYNFGLCPEEAYKNMIINILKGKSNKKQFKIDYWVHSVIDKIENGN